MPSVPVPPIVLLTDMVPRCRLLAAHGPRSCLSVRTQPLTATVDVCETVRYVTVLAAATRISSFSFDHFQSSGRMLVCIWFGLLIFFLDHIQKSSKKKKFDFRPLQLHCSVVSRRIAAGVARAAAYPVRGHVHTLVATSLRLISMLLLPGRRAWYGGTHLSSSSVQFSSVQSHYVQFSSAQITPWLVPYAQWFQPTGRVNRTPHVATGTHPWGRKLHRKIFKSG